MMMKIAAAGLLAASLFTMPAGAVELVTNGGFETGDFSGWTASGGALIDPLAPHSGDYDAIFIFGDGGIEQTLTTDAGQSYDISFWLRRDGSPPSSFDVSFGGSSLATLTNPAPFGYTLFNYTATALSASTTLSFAFNSSVGAFFIDDISVQAVDGAIPEPYTWVMMIAGFGLVGAAMRLVRRKSSLAAA